MILVADSGSTKCDWLIISSDMTMQETHTIGFNPLFHTSDFIQEELRKNDVLNKLAHSVSNVYFYGAGCSSDARKKVIRDGLKNVFTETQNITVDHDLAGAALATTHGEPGITCILGTGSNACFYDGESVHRGVSALGYILGDEGSGTYFGKQMLSDWLYHKMPSELADKFEEIYGLTKDGIFNSVYSQPNANVYLASFMKFAFDHRSHSYFHEMLYQGFARFAAIHIWCFDNFRAVPVHFVGSIAYYFKEVLQEVARNHRFTLGKIVQRPIEPLAHYHFKKSNKSNES